METTQEIDIQAARREARRQKILNNCGNRLGKITGRVVETEPISESQPQIADDYTPSTTTSTEATTPQPKITVADAQNDTPSLLAGSSFLAQKFHIIFLALFTFVVFVSKKDYIFQSNVFWPILSFKVLEMFTPLNLVTSTSANNNNILLTFFTAYCRSSENQMLFFVPKFLNFITDLLTDTMLYIFVFINAYVVHTLLTKPGEEISEVLMQT